MSEMGEFRDVADQRADTPRTAAGRRLFDLLDRHGVAHDLNLDESDILAIEAEAAAQGAAEWRSHPANQKAAAEPAAAEPCYRCGEIVDGSLCAATGNRGSLCSPACCRRGSLPDEPPEDWGPGPLGEAVVADRKGK